MFSVRDENVLANEQKNSKIETWVVRSSHEASRIESRSYHLFFRLQTPHVLRLFFFIDHRQAFLTVLFYCWLLENLMILDGWLSEAEMLLTTWASKIIVRGRVCGLLIGWFLLMSWESQRRFYWIKLHRVIDQSSKPSSSSSATFLPSIKN